MEQKDVIYLNPSKKGADNIYRKLEIPVSVPMPAREAAPIQKHVNTMQHNSNCQLEFSHGQTQVLACLFGPSQCAFKSKEDHTKGIVEVNLKEVNTEMKLDLKSCLEQIIQLSAYPKQIFTFQVTVVGKSDKRHTFAACLNACIALLNQTAICQKEAPCAAVTYNIQAEGSEGDQMVDTVVVTNGIASDQVKGILFFKSRSAIPVDQLMAALTDKNVQKSIGKSAKEICDITFN